MLNNLDLFKIRLIDELTKQGSLARAGNALGITSSAVSQNIRSLERSLGKPLFVRVGKMIKPTPLAIEIAKCSRPFFQQLSEILQSTQEQIAELKIGAPPIFGTTTLVHEIEKVCSLYPSVRISVNVLDTHKIVDDLINEKISFGIVDDGSYIKSVREIITTDLTRESLVLCCSTEFQKKYLRGRISIDLLKTLPHIPYHVGKEGIHKWYLHHFGRVPQFKWMLSIDHPYGVRTAVLQNLGIGVLPIHLVQELPDQIFVIKGPREILSSKMMLAQSKGHIPSKIEKLVISALSGDKN